MEGDWQILIVERIGPCKRSDHTRRGVLVVRYMLHHSDARPQHRTGRELSRLGNIGPVVVDSSDGPNNRAHTLKSKSEPHRPFVANA